jgi:N-acetylneuraminate synthase
MSGNHNQSLDRAYQIVDAAATAGAHAIKLQTYTADTITLDVQVGEFRITDEASPWNGDSLHSLYKKAYTPWEWHAPIMQRARERGLLCFSSPFDETAVDFLESLRVPAYKIASFENNHLPLIRKVAATGKPMIISTGMATVAELEEAVRTAREAGCSSLILLKCTSTYPASPANTNILTIPHLRELFGCQVGLSDHTKHFTLSRADGGVDSSFSLEPAELGLLVTETQRAWESLGAVTYGPTEAERKSLVFRRSLYVAEDMKAGDIFTPHNLRIVRPGNGLHPRFYEQLLGRRVIRDLKRGTPTDWSLFAC